MSTTEFKVGFVTPLPEQSNETILEFLSERIRSPESEIDEDEVYLFYPHDSYWQIIKPYEDSPWKIALWLCHERGFGSTFVSNLTEINSKAIYLAKLFDVPKETVCFAAYEYYNGADDPLCIDDLNTEPGCFGYREIWPEGLKIKRD